MYVCGGGWVYKHYIFKKEFDNRLEACNITSPIVKWVSKCHKYMVSHY